MKVSAVRPSHRRCRTHCTTTCFGLARGPNRCKAAAGYQYVPHTAPEDILNNSGSVSHKRIQRALELVFLQYNHPDAFMFTVLDQQQTPRNGSCEARHDCFGVR